MRNAVWWLLCSALMLCSLNVKAQSNVDGMTLLGMAEFTELRRPYYIAAFYADTPSSDPELLLNSNGRRRMEIRVVATRYTMRRFSNQWSMPLFINNDQSDLIKFDDSLVQFNSLLNKPFVEGDQIIIDAYDDGSSKVFVNGTEALSVARPGFLELLATKWIGKKPPSTEFKEAILNNSSDLDLEARFVSLEPSAQRIAAIEEWFKGSVAGVRINDDEAADETISEVVVTETAPEVIEEPEPAVEEVVEVAAAPEPKPAPVVEPEPEPEPEIDPAVYARQQEMLSFLYQNSVVKRILRNVEYPRRALDRNQQDKFQVKIDVDRRGNISNVQFLQESKYGLLNKAALKAIEETGKMPPVPPALDGTSIAVTVPFSFILR